MRITHFGNAAITGVACAVPTRAVRTMDNKDFSEHDLKWFIKSTGVKERRRAVGGQKASDLATAAAKQLLQEQNIDHKSIDALLFITQSADYAVPSTAYSIAHRLSLSKDCMLLDVNLGCSAFVYGVHIASSLIASKSADRVLVLIGDVFYWEYENPKDALLFGDCGSAVMVESAKGGKGIASALCSDGDRFTAIISKDGSKLSMAGDKVFDFAMTDVPATINEFLTKLDKKTSDFDYVLFHQANLVMISVLARRLGIDMAKVPVVLDKFGNIDGSSIPLALVDLKAKGEMSPKQFILSSGFGVGLSWGVNTFEIDADAILPLIETDEIWNDASGSADRTADVLSTSLGGGGATPSA